MLVEHPTGASPVLIETIERDGQTEVGDGAIISTARPLFTGQVLVPGRVMPEHGPR
jgi:2-methylaconitate cis-trans-isomerase PrpF